MLANSTTEVAALALDLGGTAIKGALVREDGHILARDVMPTERDRGPEIITGKLTAMARGLAARAEQGQRVLGLGVGVPGILAEGGRSVLLAPNLGWRDVQLAAILEAKLDYPVFMGNDANMAALGEHWVGAGRGQDPLLLITVGTGIGSGLIIGGRIHLGVGGSGAELGHVQVVPGGAPCGCGRSGCLETYVAAPAIVCRVEKSLKDGAASSLAVVNRIEARDVYQAAACGDGLAASIVNDMARTLGQALANAALAIMPRVILIGGGVAGAGHILLDPLREIISQHLAPFINFPVAILLAALGNDAGVVGAARLVFTSVSPDLPGG